MRNFRSGALWKTILFIALLSAPVYGGVSLDHVKEAMGHANMRSWQQGILVEGRGVSMGMPAGFKYIFLNDGRYRIDIDAALDTVEGFDGKKGWRVDFSGMPGLLDLADLEVKMVQAWVLGGYWLDDSCPLELAPINGKGEAILVRMPDGCVEFTLDLENNLPRKLSWNVSSTTRYAEYEDYCPVSSPAGEFHFPHKITINQEGMMETISVKRIQASPSDAAKACRPVTRRPADTFYDVEKSPSIKVKRLPSGHFIVHPLVDGKDMGWFLFDTGCGMSVIDSTTADELGMDKIGQLKAAGVGGIVDVHLRKGKSLTLGPVEIRDPIAVGIDCKFLTQAFGMKIGGLISHDFLARVLVEFDPAEPSIKLFPPGAWDDREEKWCELFFDNGSPNVEGQVAGGKKGNFSLDTGSPGTVAFGRYFIDKETLFGDSKVSEGTTGGVGGYVKQYSGRVPWFSFGGHRFDDLDVVLIMADEGAMAIRTVAGMIGNQLMNRFIMLWDVPGKRIAFLERSE